MMGFAIRVIASLLVSSNAFNILLMIPDGPWASTILIIPTATVILLFVINGCFNRAHPRTASTGGRLSYIYTQHRFSLFYSFFGKK